MECINKDTECNDNNYLDVTEDNMKQNIKPLNTNEYLNGFHNNSIESQRQYSNNFVQFVELITDNVKLAYTLNECNENEKYKLSYDGIRDNFSNLPDTLIPIVIGAIIDINNDEELIDNVPSWLDREKFSRGQRFARDYLFGIFFAESLSLFTLFSFEDGLKPLIVTGKSSEPYTAFTRYLSTANRVRNWYFSDPWTKGTAAYNDIKIVRKMHQNVRDKLNKLTNKEIDNAATINNPWSTSREILIDDFRSLCPAAKPGQCPYTIDIIRNVRPGALNQGDMAATQFGFFGLIILFPEAFGIHSATDDDLEAFCHVWRGIGYLLGVKDEFNFCRDTLSEIKKRSLDFLDYWVRPNLRDITPEWEHMMRCVKVGVKYYVHSAISYESSMLYFTNLLGLKMPRFQATLSYRILMQHYTTKLIMKYTARFSCVRYLLNRKLHRCMDRALNYDEIKHNELRERSLKTMSMISENKFNDNNEIFHSNTIINTIKYWQYKIIGSLVVITQGLILWNIIRHVNIIIK